VTIERGRNDHLTDSYEMEGKEKRREEKRREEKKAG